MTVMRMLWIDGTAAQWRDDKENDCVLLFLLSFIPCKVKYFPWLLIGLGSARRPADTRTLDVGRRRAAVARLGRRERQKGSERVAVEAGARSSQRKKAEASSRRGRTTLLPRTSTRPSATNFSKKRAASREDGQARKPDR